MLQIRCRRIKEPGFQQGEHAGRLLWGDGRRQVALADVEQLIRDVAYEIDRVSELAPGGYRNSTGSDAAAPVDSKEPLVRSEATSSASAEWEQIPVDEEGRSVLTLQEYLKQAQSLYAQVKKERWGGRGALRPVQVFDCLCERARQAASNGELELLRSLVLKGADVCAPPRARAQLPNIPVLSEISYDPHAPRCLFLASSQGARADVRGSA
eukprot:321407-Hanusia_phi.AAC.2